MRIGSVEARYLREEDGPARVGVIVPRYGSTAVARNKLKRRLRELVRLELVPGLERVSILLRARPNAYRADMEQLRREMREARERMLPAGGESAG
jgi:ribonuclease P protein component